MSTIYWLTAANACVLAFACLAIGRLCKDVDTLYQHVKYFYGRLHMSHMRESHATGDEDFEE